MRPRRNSLYRESVYNLKLAMVVNRINNMRQYFYLVGYDAFYHFEAAKIFLQEHEAVRWGRKLATKNPDYSVKLYKQEITRTGKLEFVKQLKAFYLTPEEAINLASEYHLEAEVQADIDNGMSPLEACREWDVL